MFYCVCCIQGFGLPSELLTEQKNPHCLKVTWKKATGTVTGYRVYFFSGDSQKAETVKDIPDGSQESVFVSGLKPETLYRVAVTSVSSGIESQFVFSKDGVTLRKSIIIYALNICARLNSFKRNQCLLPYFVLAGIHHLVLDQNLLALKKDLLIGKRIGKMWEQKMGPLASYILSTAKREEVTYQFIEWLKWRPLNDYNYFVALLHKTEQEKLAEHLTTSCKFIFI